MPDGLCYLVSITTSLHRAVLLCSDLERAAVLSSEILTQSTASLLRNGFVSLKSKTQCRDACDCCWPPQIQQSTFRSPTTCKSNLASSNEKGPSRPDQRLGRVPPRSVSRRSLGLWSCGTCACGTGQAEQARPHLICLGVCWRCVGPTCLGSVVRLGSCKLTFECSVFAVSCWIFVPDCVRCSAIHMCT